ncbi:DnaJ family domain-containing protein [Bounagaea algeriensis]
MTERKPPHLDFESWIDRQVREAAERGEFDDLPGAGRPLSGLHRTGEAWWIKERVQREGMSAEELLPAPLRLRKEIERLPETVRDLPDEQAVRETATALNRRIAAELRAPTGPRVRLAPVDVEELVRQWREQRRQARSAQQAGGPTAGERPAGQSRLEQAAQQAEPRGTAGPSRQEQATQQAEPHRTAERPRQEQSGLVEHAAEPDAGARAPWWRRALRLGPRRRAARRAGR